MVAVANDVRVLHVRGVSSRSRPLFVEWHKHRGLWRYFRKFEAPRRGVLATLRRCSRRSGCVFRSRSAGVAEAIAQAW